MNEKFLKIASYEDLKSIQSGSSDEVLVPVDRYNASVAARYEKLDMKEISGDVIYVRDSVAKKVAKAQEILNRDFDSSFNILVVYGYRHPDIQKKYFDEQMRRVKCENVNFSNDEARAYAHQFVAVPDVAGHVTGGAVDVAIVGGDGNMLDFGSPIASYEDELIVRTFADGATPEQLSNRILLHDIMVSVGFAPFYGEWWHFSYGDKEWAFLNSYEKALYGGIDFKI